MVSERPGDEAWDTLLESRQRLLMEISSRQIHMITQTFDSHLIRIYITLDHDPTPSISRFTRPSSPRPDL